MNSRDEIACPACGEPILAIAQKCKHCGEWRTSTEAPQVPPPAPPASGPVAAPLQPAPDSVMYAAPPARGMSLPKALAIGCGVVAAGIVGIGILAAIAIPKFSDTKERALQAAVKADLRNLTTAQEMYFDQFNRYATNLGELSPAYFVPAPDVSITIRPIDPLTWEAVATHSGSVGFLCQIRYGAVGAPGDGVPTCRSGQ